jgi:hypothetical protein
MRPEAVLLALIVLIVIFVFVMPMALTPKKEGFAGSGISLFDSYIGDPAGFNAVGAKKYNKFSDVQDVTVQNYAQADTDRAIDLASETLRAALTTASIAVDPTSKTFEGVRPDVPAVGVAPMNQIVMEARKCEALNSRDNCKSLDDPNYANCGVCIQDRTTLFKNQNDPYKHGGLLILPDDRRDAKAAHGNRPGPVQYTATVGNCPPGYLFVDRASCERGANRLDCKEAGENGGFNKGRTSEGKEVINKCANAPTAGNDVFVYDTTSLRSFDVNLRVLTPTGTGITKVYVTDKATGRQIGYATNEKPGVSFVVPIQNVKEGQSLDITIAQEVPHRNKGKAEVFQYAVDTNSQNTPWYNQTIATSKNVCARIGARSATDAELQQAWSEGAQACSCGNTTSTNAYPGQANRGGCGGIGINGCPTSGGWNNGYGHSWCYGVKPPNSSNNQWYTQVLKWFTTHGDQSSPPQTDKPNIWSKWGDDYQAPAHRAVIMQWEHVADSRRMAQPFEPSITAVNDMGPSTVSSDGLKTFKILRRFGTFKSSTIITAPRPASSDPMVTSQFWIWGNQENSMTVKFTAQIPGTFTLPFYTEDATVVPRGQLVASAATFKLLQVSPCLKDGQIAGKYSDACLANLFLGSGGDLGMGKLATNGMVDPYDGSTGNGLKDLNKLGDIDAISAYLDSKYSLATTGRDANGVKVGGGNGKARALAVNTAAQLMFGFDVTSPCEDVEEDAQGTIIIVPRKGGLDADCLQWLWQNTGSDKDRYNEDPTRFAAPHKGGIYNTYTTIADRYSGLRNGEGTPKKREASPFQTCQATGTMAPVDSRGQPNAKNIALANTKGGINAVQQWYDSIHKMANYGGGSKDATAMTKHADYVAQCYGMNKSLDSTVAAKGCGVGTRYVYILPNAIYPSWDNNGLCMQLPQVEVFDVNGQEIAKGKRTAAASVWPGTTPDMAVDGKKYPHSHGEGEYHDRCTTPDNQYWMVDLGKNYDVAKVKVYQRTDCCQQRFLAMPVQLKNESNQITAQKWLGQGQWPNNVPNMTFTLNFTGADAKAQFTYNTVSPGSAVTLQSSISWDRVLRHAGFAGYVHGPDQGTNSAVYSPLESKDASFMVRPANNGRSGYISFESVNFPNHFLRHAGFRIWLHYRDGSGIYNEDSSFKPVPALNKDLTMVSFQSANFPDHYLVAHRDAPDQAWIQPCNGNNGWDAQHGSWKVIQALSS